MLRLLLLMCALGLHSVVPTALAETTESETGLEVENPSILQYFLSLEADGGPSLTQGQLAAQVELRFRSAGVRPVRFPDPPGQPYVHVIITVYERGFNVMVHFNRKVTFIADGTTYQTTATTWGDGTSGTHGGDGDYIIRALNNYLDQLLADYLRTNEDALSKRE